MKTFPSPHSYFCLEKVFQHRDNKNAPKKKRMWKTIRYRFDV